MVNRPISAQEIAASVTERLGLPAEVRKGGGVRVSGSAHRYIITLGSAGRESPTLGIDSGPAFCSIRSYPTISRNHVILLCGGSLLSCLIFYELRGLFSAGMPFMAVLVLRGIWSSTRTNADSPADEMAEIADLLRVLDVEDPPSSGR